MAIDSKAFGPSSELADAKMATGAASSAAGLGKLFGYSDPYVSGGLAAANLGLDLAANPSNAGVTAAKAAGAALPAGAALGAAALDSSLSAKDAFASSGGGPFMALWNAPQLVASLDNLFDPPDYARMARREMDAKTGASQMVQGLDKGLSMRTPIGGSTLGNAYSSMLNFNLGGGWSPGGESGMGWYPDPALAPFSRALHARGFPGTQEENGQLVRREPEFRDVGGVGEIVQGGGFEMPNAKMSRDNLLRLGIDPDKNPGAVVAQRYEPGYENETGAQAWDSFLRQKLGVPSDTPSVFDFTPQRMTDPGDIQNAALKVGIDPEKNPAGFGAWMQDTPPMTDPKGDYMTGLASLFPEAAGRVAQNEQRRRDQEDVNRFTAGGGGTG